MLQKHSSQCRNGITWGRTNRRSLAEQDDNQTDPAKGPEREYWWELACQVSETEESIAKWQLMNDRALPSEAALKETQLVLLKRRLDNLQNERIDAEFEAMSSDEEYLALMRQVDAEWSAGSARPCARLREGSLRMARPIIRRGEIHWYDADPVLGSEQGGMRPGVIITRDAINRNSPVVVVVPCTAC